MWNHRLFLSATTALLVCSFGGLPEKALAQDNDESGMSLNTPFQDSFNSLDHAACVTLFHRKGRLGCGTEDRNFHIGKLIYYQYDSNNGQSNNAFPNVGEDFVVVLEEYDLTANTLNLLASGNEKGYMKGLLFLNSSAIDADRDKAYYSPAAQTPRGYGTPSQNIWYGNNQYPWNAKGQGLNIYDFYGFPMAYVPDSDVSSALRKEAKNQANHNSGENANPEDDSTSIVAEFNYYMGPDGIDSMACLGWRDQADGDWAPKCLPLGGTSVWAVAGSPEANNNNKANDDDNANANDDANNDDGGQRRQLNNNNYYYYDANSRPVVILATGLDSTSLFHDVVPGANSAASNILALLMAAKLLGAVGDNLLDKLPYRIVFAFFQGETYGFLGSRNFLRDVAFPGFQCYNGKVNSVANDDNSEKACLYPLRHSLEFQNLGPIAGMLAVDQVGLPVADGLLYVHNDGQGDGTYGNFLSNVLKYSYTSNFAVSYTSIENDDYGWPFPPSPLQSLVQLSQGAAGGAVLTGYDYAFTNQVPYHSHMESNKRSAMDLDAIASAATLLARAALAAAYDGGQFDAETSSQYAAQWIGELSSNDETLNVLANCLFTDGNCDYLQKYNSMERQNDKAQSGFTYGSGYPLGTPPNYYTGVYNINYGQPFVQVGDNVYGAYDGDNYGKRGSDSFGIQPTVLESSIRGLLNDFLGRGANLNGGSLQDCSKPSDCDNVDYCQKNGDRAVCAGGGQCVCARSHFHPALDEALEAKPGKATGYFVQSNNDQGISAVYTEPFWSNDVGVRVYRSGGALPGIVTLGVGGVTCALCVLGAFVLRVGLKKEKMY